MIPALASARKLGATWFSAVVTLLCAASLSTTAAGDSIQIGERVFENVYVHESPRMYYVLLPETGDVLSVRKSEEVRQTLAITEDPAEREALRARWRAAQAPESAPVTGTATPAEANSAPGEAKTVPTLRLRREAPPAETPEATTGAVHLENVPLSEALHVALRSENLDYRVEPGYVYISTPERLRTEANAPVETRVYALSSGAEASLPKVVVSGSTSGGYGGTGYSGGSGGGYGGFGGGFGGGYGGGYGGMSDVTVISNISDLFSTIDDRTVGEAPAEIPRIVIR